MRVDIKLSCAVGRRRQRPTVLGKDINGLHSSRSHQLPNEDQRETNGDFNVDIHGRDRFIHVAQVLQEGPKVECAVRGMCHQEGAESRQ